MHCALISDDLSFIGNLVQTFFNSSEFSLDITWMIRYFDF